MLIDHTHRSWFIGTITALLLAALAYGTYSYFSPYGPAGGTIPGIAFGAAGYGLMWMAGLLWWRKKSRRQRFGRPQWWMRAHLWMGLLSYPLIFFHAGGLHFGHGLTLTLMWALTLVIITGVLGAFLQHFTPRLITQHVPMESIYNNINDMLEKLKKDAEKAIAPFCNSSDQEELQPDLLQAGDTLTLVAPSVATAAGTAAEFQYRYERNIKPYLAKRFIYRHQLSSGRASEEFFKALRTNMPEEIVIAVNKLEEICKEKRDLDRQTMMHRVLHGWLLVHVPLSALVLVLGAVHAIMALRYR